MICDQQIKQIKFLKTLKERRHDSFDKIRGICKFLTYDEYYQHRKSSLTSTTASSVCQDHKVYMLSDWDWLTEKPADFENNWLVVAYPKAERSLVSTHKGITKLCLNNGLYCMECYTALPGGNPDTYIPQNENDCILDGYYVKETRTFYVLDVLEWRKQHLVICETGVRQFYLKSHLMDIKELFEITMRNQVLFELLPMVACSTESFEHFMMKFPHFASIFPSIGGLLFYNKMAHYYSDHIGRLYPYMVKEVLGSHIPVNSIYEIAKPTNYVNLANFIQNYRITVGESIDII